MVKNNVKTYLKINSFGEQQQLIDLLFIKSFTTLLFYTNVL
nr:MAG TPA: hypothetical protein [Caudoviricetes sp.]